jgi:hypothetical protein
MNRVQYRHHTNLNKGYGRNLAELLPLAGCALVQITNHRYLKAGYGATWMQRIQYQKNGESRVAYQFCGDGINGEFFGSWFWCPMEHDCSLDFASDLVRPEWDKSNFRQYDELPEDMGPKFF